METESDPPEVEKPKFSNYEADLKILNDLSCSGSIIHHAAIQWSQGNKIAICTDKGIYILSSHCSPTESHPIPLQKQFISVSTETQNFDTLVNKADLLEFMERDDKFNMMLDPTISPQTSNASLFQTFRRALWSPAGAAGYKQCLLATLGMDHRLLIHSEIGNKWVVICDLSQTFYEECLNTKWGLERLDKVTTSLKASIGFRILKDRSYTLAAVEMVWTHMFGVDLSSTGRWCYLISATKNGHLMFWRVCIQQETKARMVFHLKSDAISLIKSLFWQPIGPSSGLLLLGCHSGEILVLPISENMSEKGTSGLAIGEAKVLWKDKDRIVPSCLIVLKQNRENYYIVCTKGQFLILAEAFVLKNELIIQKTSYYSGQFSFPATGLSVCEKRLPQKSFLLTSQDGRVLKINISTSEGNPKFTVTQEIVKLINDDVRLVPQGVTNSPNYAMQAVIFNIGSLYDHLLIKDPLRIVIFSMSSVANMTAELLRQTRGIVLVPLCSTFGDLLDCMQGHFFQGVAAEASLLKLLDSDAALQPISTLQLIRFIIKTILAGTIAFEKDHDELRKQNEEIENLIMQKHCINICQSAMTRMEHLSLQQRASYGLMTQWLQSTYEICLTQFDADIAGTELTTLQEFCKVCGLQIPLNNILKGVCPNGHQFARCCLSLLLCDMVEQLKCCSCGSFSLKDNVWTLKLHCLFCGMVLR